MYLFDGLWCRPDTMDEYIVRECRHQYDALEVAAGDRVLDVGANIGAFAVPMARRGAVVTAIEPEIENYVRLVMNIGELPVRPIRAAVAPWAGEVDLYVTPGSNKGHHSTVISKGRAVQKVPGLVWRDVLADPYDVLKFDAEGAQYLLGWDDLPTTLERVAIVGSHVP